MPYLLTAHCIFLVFLLAGCKAGKNADATISIEPSVITVNNGQGNYKRADEGTNVEEAEAEEAFEYEYIYDDVNKVYSKEANSPDSIVLTFAGDTCFYDGFSLMSKFKENGSDIDNCIDASLLDEMRGADIFMINNEFCYSERGAPIEGKQYAFRAKPEHVKILTDMGADIVSLANNHAYDWGPDALCDTIDTLNEEKIPFVGAGKNISEAMRPAYFKVNGITIAYVSATQIERNASPDTKEATESSPGVLRTLNSAKACKVINEAKSNSDFVVMYVHWGSENTDLVEQSQRDLANDYIEAGADLIIGDHSHCLQGIDFIEDVPVFYSLGNYWFNSKSVDTGLAKITLDKNANISSVKFIPARQHDFGTHVVDEAGKTRILTYLQGISDFAMINLTDGTIVKSDVNHNTQNGQNTSPTRRAKEPDTQTQEVQGEQIPAEVSGE